MPVEPRPDTWDDVARNYSAEITPEALRAGLKLNGSRAGTLLIGGKGPTRAILAQRVGPS